MWCVYPLVLWGQGSSTHLDMLPAPVLSSYQLLFQSGIVLRPILGSLQHEYWLEKTTQGESGETVCMDIIGLGGVQRSQPDVSFSGTSYTL